MIPTRLASVDIAEAERVWWKLKKCQKLSANTVAFISCKSRVLIFLQFSPDSFCSSDVYRCESGRCCSLPLILKYFLSFNFPGFPFILIFTNGERDLSYSMTRLDILFMPGDSMNWRKSWYAVSNWQQMWSRTTFSKDLSDLPRLSILEMKPYQDDRIDPRM